MLMKSNISAIHLFCLQLVFPFSFFLCPIFVLLGIQSRVLGMADNVPYHWSHNYLVPTIDNSNFKKLLLPLFCQLRSAVNPWNAFFFWVSVLLWRCVLGWMRDVPLVSGIWTLGPQLVSLFKWRSLQKEVSHWVGVGFEIQSPVPLPVLCLCFMLTVEDVHSQLPACCRPPACCHASLPWPTLLPPWSRYLITATEKWLIGSMNADAQAKDGSQGFL